MYFEKDAEIDFLQKEISSLMQEKYDKESIIKSKKIVFNTFYSSYSWKFETFELDLNYLSRLEAI